MKVKVKIGDLAKVRTISRKLNRNRGIGIVVRFDGHGYPVLAWQDGTESWSHPTRLEVISESR